jgi:GDP-D-mannose dehydratase
LVKPVTVQLCEPVGAVTVLATVHDPLGVPATVYVLAVPSAVKVTFNAPDPALVTVGVANLLVVVTAAEAADTVDVVELPEGVTVNV